MDRIWVWDDGDVASRLQKEREAYEMLEFEVDSDEDDVSSDSDSDSESLSISSVQDNDKSSPSRSKRRRIRHSEDSERESERDRNSPVLSESDNDNPRSQKRSRRGGRQSRAEKSPEQKVSREQRDVYRAILSRYYNRGTGLGMSVAGMIFILAEALGRAENEGLWLAILGLTAQYAANAIPFDVYEKQATSIASDVVALNPPLVDTTGGQSASSLSKPVSADDGRIRVIHDELRFTLYRHWSLESAMYHTPYVAGKLGVWREKGLIKIRGLLAKMGFSLIHSRQHYNNMPLDLRKSLTGRLEAIAPEYGLTELVFKSFVRSFGFRSNPLSAGDTVEGLNALLVAATGLRIEIQDDELTFSGVGPSSLDRGAWGGGGTPISSELFGAKRLWNIGGGSSSDSSAARGEDKETQPSGLDIGDDSGIVSEDAVASHRQSEAWVRNFFIAYEALDFRRSSSLSMLSASLSLARSLHTAILGVGTSLIDKQSIRTLKSFRLAVLRDGPHLDVFSTQPAMLTRLGMWLTDALRDIVTEQERKKRELKRQRKESKIRRRPHSARDGAEEADEDAAAALTSLPFVLCALDATRDIYLVVGLIGSPEFGDVKRNRFGLAFQEAIRRSGSRSRTEGWFDTTAVEIRKEDLSGFVEQLHLRA